MSDDWWVNLRKALEEQQKPVQTTPEQQRLHRVLTTLEEIAKSTMSAEDWRTTSEWLLANVSDAPDGEKIVKILMTEIARLRGERASCAVCRILTRLRLILKV
jgi:hypothetical protein